MNSVLRPLVLSVLFIWAGTSTQAADLTPFSVPASDSAAVRRIYGIGAFANPASKASVSVDSGILRAEFDLASDSTEGWSANVGLTIQLNPDGGPVNLGRSGGTPMNRLRFDHRLSAPITDVFDWTLESVAYPPQYPNFGRYISTQMGREILAASANWKTVVIESGDFWSDANTLHLPLDDFPSFDSILTGVTGFRIEPKTLYSASGFQKGTACTKCVNPTMKHLVMELRNIRIDRLGPAGDTIPLVLGLPKAQVGVARRMAAPVADIFWQGGILRISQPSRWSSLSVLAPDGRHLRTLTSLAAQPLDLPPGTYHLLLIGRDGRSASMAVVGLR